MKSLRAFCASSLLAAIAVPAMTMMVAPNAFAGSATYTYDTLGRVVKVVYSNGVVITYSYDAAGNRTATVVTGAAA